MIFPNYYKMMYIGSYWENTIGLVARSYSGDRYSKITVTNLSGNWFSPYVRANENNTTNARNTIINVMRMNYNYRIALGTGDNTYTGDEYCLANDISSNFSNLAYSYASEVVTTGNTKLERTITVTGTNSSNQSQTITELAYIKQVAYSATDFYEVLYAICTLDEPITVAAGANFTALFKWDTQAESNVSMTMLDNWYKLRNLYETLSDIKTGQPQTPATNTGIIDVVNYEVSPTIVPVYDKADTDWIFGWGYSLNKKYIQLGTGNNTYTGDEYCLANDITQNFSNVYTDYNNSYAVASQSQLYFPTNTSIKTLLMYQAKNNSQTDQTITEIGLVARPPELDGTYDRTVLIAIYKLDSPITVKPGESFSKIIEFEIA